MSRQNKDTPPGSGTQQRAIRSFTEFFDHAAFTDGGAAVGTHVMAGSIPKGAIVLDAEVVVQEGFAGDTSAVLTIGDGTDVDRYNTSTVNVFADAENGIAAGLPSGAKFHTAAVTPTLTITTAADWGSVTAGKVLVTINYIEPRA